MEKPGVVTGRILADYDPKDPARTADTLRQLWLAYEPKSIEAIKAEERLKQETAGIPVPVLKEIGKRIGQAARKDVDGYLPLATLMWRAYGREGRVVACLPLGAMELVDPRRLVPLLKTLCRECHTWEDADRLAMDALEPIVRKDPERWLGAMDDWLADENKWVRRAGVTVAGRLPMKQAAYTGQTLGMAERLLGDGEEEVKKAVSFAIRLAARGDAGVVCEWLAEQVPPEGPEATWVLCDAIRSMAKQLLPQFAALLPRYQAWGEKPELSGQERRSVESAIGTLVQAAGG